MKNMTVIGAGTQGSMIAFRNAYYGKNVAIFDLSKEQIETAMSKIENWFEEFAAKGQISTEKAQEMFKNIRVASSMEEALENADIVIENVPENLGLKQKVWKQLDSLAPEKTIITTNSSSIRSSHINTDVKRKDKTFNLNFAMPVEDDFVEVMWNKDTSDQTKNSVLDYLESLNHHCLVTKKEIKGFAINRLWRAMKKECLYLWANGYTDPEDFDAAFKMEWGTGIGPYQLMDKVGLDVVYDIEMSYYNESQDESDYPPEKLKDMVEKGYLGVKNGKGFYEYE